MSTRNSPTDKVPVPSQQKLVKAPTQGSLSPTAQLSSEAATVAGPRDAKAAIGKQDEQVLPAEDEDEKYVTDPDFLFDFVEKIDEHVKMLLMAIMFMATLIWGVFFYTWYNLPTEIFAKNEIEQVFLPPYYWSGVYTLIACPWFSSVYCLLLVVYPDPRTWRFCFRPRRVWRWVPYIILLMYSVVVNSFWLYKLFLIPSNIHRRMLVTVKNSLNQQTTKFPVSWEYVQNYYQCCGIKSKEDWTHKTIPTSEIPFPFKKDKVCKTFFYGKQSNTSQYCSEGNFSELGVLWPASCCNNYTGQTGCTSLPTSSEIWTGHCYNAEISLALSTVVVPMVLSIAINVIGVFAFFKTRILESIALRQKLQPPASHI